MKNIVRGKMVKSEADAAFYLKYLDIHVGKPEYQEDLGKVLLCLFSKTLVLEIHL